MPIAIDSITSQLVRDVLSVPHDDREPLLPGQATLSEYAALDALHTLAQGWANVLPPDGGQDTALIGERLAELEATIALLIRAKNALSRQYGVQRTAARLYLFDITTRTSVEVPIVGINREDCRQQLRGMIDRLGHGFFDRYGIQLASDREARVIGTNRLAGYAFSLDQTTSSTVEFRRFSEAADWFVGQLKDDSPCWRSV